MAKKNLASLMSGIMGESPVQPEPQPAQAIQPAPAQSAPATPAVSAPAQTAPAAETAPRRKPGRPRKSEAPGKEAEIRATFIVDPELLRKVKYISLVEGLLLKDVIGAALADHIQAWEAANGKIRLPRK